MKYIKLMGLTVALFMVCGTVYAGKSIIVDTQFAQVKGDLKTNVYRMVDAEYGNVCYYSYTKSSIPDVECVHVD